ncbi:MAG TPA: hypothetical protein VFD03_06130 [Clostridia bacterium]|nr:hypothetical protein [Clostridia bacterium]
MIDLLFIDYWTCDECKNKHYGCCLKCGKCGRKFDKGFLINPEEYPSSDD